MHKHVWNMKLRGKQTKHVLKFSKLLKEKVQGTRVFEWGMKLWRFLFDICLIPRMSHLFELRIYFYEPSIIHYSNSQHKNSFPFTLCFEFKCAQHSKQTWMYLPKKRRRVRSLRNHNETHSWIATIYTASLNTRLKQVITIICQEVLLFGFKLKQ